MGTVIFLVGRSVKTQVTVLGGLTEQEPSRNPVKLVFLSIYIFFWFNMLSTTTLFRNAALMSVRHTASIRLAPVTARRAYATENGEKSEANEAPKEEVQVQAELSEETKKLLAEKDKKISEIQVIKIINVYKLTSLGCIPSLSC